MGATTPEAHAIETLFYIPNKDGVRKTGVKVPYILNASQSAYDEVRTNRDMIPKARQKGFSSFGIALQSIDCLGKEGTRAVLISHEAKATQRLLDKASYYFKHMDGPKPILGRHSRNEFYFPKTESSFYIGTAGARAFGRGDTITHLHISEYAWWEGDALKQVAGLFQAVPQEGVIRIESTGKGKNNDFYYMCMNAELLGYKVFFRSWHADDEYKRLIPTQGWNPDGQEHYFQDMKTEYNLNEEQLFWYWVKLLEFRSDLNMMQQEYPSSLEESFQASGGAIFPTITKVKSEYWNWEVKDGRRIERLDGHPKEKRTYVFGADPSGGTGNDEAGLTGVCLETLEQVFEFGSNRIDPVDFAYYLNDVLRWYNEAYVVCEANNHGIATHSVLTKIYLRAKIYKRAIPTKTGKPLYGWMNSENAKKGLCGNIKELDDMGLSIYGTKTFKQISEFEEDKEGKLEAPEDGLVIALGLASLGCIKWQSRAFDISPPPRPKVPIDHEKQNYMFFTFEEMIENIDRQGQKIRGYPRMIN